MSSWALCWRRCPRASLRSERMQNPIIKVKPLLHVQCMWSTRHGLSNVECKPIITLAIASQHQRNTAYNRAGAAYLGCGSCHDTRTMRRGSLPWARPAALARPAGGSPLIPPWDGTLSPHVTADSPETPSSPKSPVPSRVRAHDEIALARATPDPMAGACRSLDGGRAWHDRARPPARRASRAPRARRSLCPLVVLLCGRGRARGRGV